MSNSRYRSMSRVQHGRGLIGPRHRKKLAIISVAWAQAENSPIVKTLLTTHLRSLGWSLSRIKEVDGDIPSVLGDVKTLSEQGDVGLVAFGDLTYFSGHCCELVLFLAAAKRRGVPLLIDGIPRRFAGLGFSALIEWTRQAVSAAEVPTASLAASTETGGE